MQGENNQTEPDPTNDDAEVVESNVDEEAGNTVPAENGGNEAWIDTILLWKVILVCTLTNVKKINIVDDFSIMSYL